MSEEVSCIACGGKGRMTKNEAAQWFQLIAAADEVYALRAELARLKSLLNEGKKP